MVVTSSPGSTLEINLEVQLSKDSSSESRPAAPILVEPDLRSDFESCRGEVSLKDPNLKDPIRKDPNLEVPILVDSWGAIVEFLNGMNFMNVDGSSKQAKNI